MAQLLTNGAFMNPSRERYFVAIVPPTPLLEEINEMKFFVEANYDSRAALRSPPHITMHMPFEWKPAKEQELIRQLDRFASACEPVSIDLDGFGSFPPRV